MQSYIFTTEYHPWIIKPKALIKVNKQLEILLTNIQAQSKQEEMAKEEKYELCVGRTGFLEKQITKNHKEYECIFNQIKAALNDISNLDKKEQVKALKLNDLSILENALKEQQLLVDRLQNSIRAAEKKAKKKKRLIKYLKEIKENLNQNKAFKLKKKALIEIFDWTDWTDEEYQTYTEKVNPSNAGIFQSLLSAGTAVGQYITWTSSLKENFKNDVEKCLMKLKVEKRRVIKKIAITKESKANINNRIIQIKEIKSRIIQYNSESKALRKINRIIQRMNTYHISLTKLHQKAQELPESNKQLNQSIIENYTAMIIEISLNVNDTAILTKINQSLNEAKFELPILIKQLNQDKEDLKIIKSQLERESASISECLELSKEIKRLNTDINLLKKFVVNFTWKSSDNFDKQFKELETWKNEVESNKKSAESATLEIKNIIATIDHLIKDQINKTSAGAKLIDKFLTDEKAQLETQSEELSKNILKNDNEINFISVQCNTHKSQRELKIKKDQDKKDKKNVERKVEQFDKSLDEIASLKLLKDEFNKIKEIIPLDQKSLNMFVHVFQRINKDCFNNEDNFSLIKPIIESFSSFLNNLTITPNFDLISIQPQIVNIIRLLALNNNKSFYPVSKFHPILIEHFEKLVGFRDIKDPSEICADLLSCSTVGLNINSILTRLPLSSFLSKIERLDDVDILINAISLSQKTHQEDDKLKLALDLVLEEKPRIAKKQHTNDSANDRANYLSKINAYAEISQVINLFDKEKHIFANDENPLKLFAITLRQIATIYSSPQTNDAPKQTIDASDLKSVLTSLFKFINELTEKKEAEKNEAEKNLGDHFISILNSLNKLNINLSDSNEEIQKVKSIITNHLDLKGIRSRDISACILICARAGFDITKMLEHSGIEEMLKHSTIKEMLKLLRQTDTCLGLKQLSEILFACYLNDANSELANQIPKKTIKQFFDKVNLLINSQRIINVDATINHMNLVSPESHRHSESSSLKSSTDARYLLQAAAFYDIKLSAVAHDYFSKLLSSNDEQNPSSIQRKLCSDLRKSFSKYKMIEVSLEKNINGIFSADIYIANKDTGQKFVVEYDGAQHYYKRISDLVNVESNENTNQNEQKLRREDVARDALMCKLGYRVIRFTKSDIAGGRRGRRSVNLQAFIKEVIESTKETLQPKADNDQSRRVSAILPDKKIESKSPSLDNETRFSASASSLRNNALFPPSSQSNTPNSSQDSGDKSLLPPLSKGS